MKTYINGEEINGVAINGEKILGAAKNGEVFFRREVVLETTITETEEMGVYKITFASDWKTANLQIYNMLGRRIFNQENIDLNQPFMTQEYNIGTYIIRVISDTGIKVDKKIDNGKLKIIW